MTGGLANPANRPRQNSFGCSPDQDITLTCPYRSSCRDSSCFGCPQVAGFLHSNRSLPWLRGRPALCDPGAAGPG